MSSAQAALTSNEQQRLNVLLSALPESYGAVSCDTYKAYRPIIQAALPLIARLLPARAAAALRYAVQVADVACGAEPPRHIDARRQVAQQILERACHDPRWRAQLLSSPGAALAAAGFAQEIAALHTAAPLAPEHAPGAGPRA